MVKLFQDIVKDVKDKFDEADRHDEFYGARLIFSTLRSVTCEELEWYLNDVIELKQEFPDLIAGRCIGCYARPLSLKNMLFQALISLAMRIH